MESVAKVDSTTDTTDTTEARPPVKGLRKPSTTAAKRHKKEHSSKRYLDKLEDPHPTEYLYFGDGKETGTMTVSGSQTANTGIGSSSASTSRNRPTGGAKGLGNDGSGFMEQGLTGHTQQMGYSSLTYGGSLQFDYTGAQGSGVTGIAGVGGFAGGGGLAGVGSSDGQ